MLKSSIPLKFWRWPLIQALLLLFFYAPSAEIQKAHARSISSVQVPSVPLLKIDKPLTQAVTEQLSRALLEARFKRLPAVFIELDTYGGFEDSTSEILQLVLNSDIPVIVWTPPTQRAHRAGSLLLVSAHFSAMSKESTAGVQTFVASDPEQSHDHMQPKKIRISRQRLQVLLDEIVEKRKKNESSIRELLDEVEAASADSLVSKGLINGVFETREEVWSAARLQLPQLPEKVQFSESQQKPKEVALEFISDPNVSFGLLALGALGIYAEVTYGGLILPGAIGAVALTTAVLSMRVIPIRPMAILLLIFGLFLIAIEVLTPLMTYGVSGFFGALSLFFSGLFLVNSKESDILLEPGIWVPIFVLVIIFMSFFSFQSFRAVRAQRKGRSIHSLIGQTGVVQRVFSPDEALVLFEDEYRSARWADKKSAEALRFQKGSQVKVIEQHGFVVYVSPPENSA